MVRYRNWRDRITVQGRALAGHLLSSASAQHRPRAWGRGLICLFLAGTLVLPGCALMGGGKNRKTAKTFNWLGPDKDEELEDNWGFVGKENRNGKTLEKEDWLDRLIWSDQARQINHNLGVN